MKLDLPWKPKVGVALLARKGGCECAVTSVSSPVPRLISRPTPPPAPGAAASPAFTAGHWLAQLLPEVGRKRFRLGTVIGSELLFCKRLTFPSADPTEVRRMVALQVDKICPLPPEEVVWSFEVLGTEGGQTDVLVAFGRREELNRCAADFGEQYLPDLIDVDLLVLWRSLREKQRIPSGDGFGLLLWVSDDGQAVKCMLLKSQSPLAVEHLPMDPADPQALCRVLSVFLLGAEATLGMGQIRWILLVGPASRQAELQSRLEADLAVPVTPIAWEAELSTVVGVARRALNGGEGHLNLLPEEFAERRRKHRFRQQALQAGAIVGAVYLLALAVAGLGWQWKRWALQRLDAEIRRMDDDYTRARLLEAEVAFLNKKMDDRRSALELLRVANEARPDEVSWQSFHYRQGQGVEVRGVADTDGAVSTYLEKLRETGLFAQVKPGPIKNIPNRGTEVTFDVSCTFESALPAGSR